MGALCQNSDHSKSTIHQIQLPTNQDIESQKRTLSRSKKTNVNNYPQTFDELISEELTEKLVTQKLKTSQIIASLNKETFYLLGLGFIDRFHQEWSQVPSKFESKQDQIKQLVFIIFSKFEPMIKEVEQVQDYQLMLLIDFYHFTKELPKIINQKNIETWWEDIVEKLTFDLIYQQWQQKFIRAVGKSQRELYTSKSNVALKLQNHYQKQCFITCNFSKTKEWIKKQNEDNLFDDFDDKHEASRVQDYYFPTSK